MIIHKWVMVCVVAATLTGCNAPISLSRRPAKDAPMLTTFQDHQQVTIYVGDSPFTVEIVNTASSTAQGLSGRQEIGTDGMLFIFPNAQVRYFWMKEMLFAIDIVWIQDQKIVGITKNVQPPQPNTPLSQLPTYPSPQAVTMVLEVPAGFADQHQWQIGTPISLEQR